MYMCVCVWRGSKQAKPKSCGTNAENMGWGLVEPNFPESLLKANKGID